MTDSTENSPPGTANDLGVPKELWKVGVAFSVLLIAIGLLVMAVSNSLFSVGALAVCIGFGVALAVFGNRAGGRFLTFNVAGGGAMAVALYLLLMKFPIAPPPETIKYLRGEIYQTDKVMNVRGLAKQLFLTGRIAENGSFRFVVFENEIGDGFVRFNFDFPDDGAVKEFFIDCISSKEFKSYIGKGDLALYLEEQTGGRFRLFDRAKGIAIGGFNQQDCAANPTEPSVNDEVGFLDWLSIAAHAQEGKDIDIRNAIDLLESDDGDERDSAREQLASLRGAEAYEVVVGSWDVDDSSYRADLGRLVAWSAAIGQDRATAVTLAEALSPVQLAYLVQLTGQGDITLRQFATEVLHRLLETTSWPNGPSPARAEEIVAATLAGMEPSGIKAIPKPDVQFKPDSVLYNSVVALLFAQCNIGASYRPSVIEALSELATRLKSAGDAPKTAANVAKALTALEKCN